MRKEKAFTLIELLVVIAIISLLVSILLPSLTKAKELARQAACQMNMKSLGLAAEMYAGDYGYYPYLRLGLGDPTWGRLLWSYMGEDVKAYQCPTNQCVPASYVTLYIDWHKGLSSYSANIRAMDYPTVDCDYDGSKGGRKPEDIARAAEKILFAEVHHGENTVGGLDLGGWTYVAGHSFSYVDGFYANWFGLADTNGRVHDEGANYTFADGHSEWVAFSDMEEWFGDDPVHPSSANPWAVDK